MSLFSIIVPVYNTEKYIDKCVCSVFGQSFDDYELILVDDGSPDNCPKICDDYAMRDKRVKVIHKKNGGLVSARQAGIKEAVGQYIVHLDSDDWLENNYLEKFAGIIKKYSPDVICSDHYIAGQDNVKWGMKFEAGFYDREALESRLFPSLIQKTNATYFMPSVWAKAFKREIITDYQNSVPQALKIGEDCAVVIPTIYSARSLFIVEDALYYYRVNDSSMTKQKRAFDWNGPELIHKHLEAYINMEEYDFKEQLYRKTTHEIFTVVVSQFNRRESYRNIVRDIKKNISRDVYAESIKKCRFSGSIKAKFMELALKYKLMFPIFIYSKIKK